ncbi:transposase [Streptomyces avidinii]|uniref:transposase n=1 Tax=Streptomyces avidinii TaxID=1895 RepID=UPI0038659737|nr:transposase [Streptomyces avidinii]
MPVRTPRLLGIDGFVFRKARTYGAVLVDVESSRPVDVLPDREAGTVAAWFQEHPGARSSVETAQWHSPGPSPSGQAVRDALDPGPPETLNSSDAARWKPFGAPAQPCSSGRSSGTLAGPAVLTALRRAARKARFRPGETR